MNFETLQLHVKRNLGNRQDADFSTLVNEWINGAYLDIITTGKFPEAGRFATAPIPELDTTTDIMTGVGGTDYAVPTLFLFPISLRDLSNDTPIFLRDIRWYDRYRSTTNGKPQYYILFSRRLYIDPPSDGVYQLRLRYRKKVSVPSLTALTDIPAIGEEWHEGLELAATYRGARSLQFPNTDTWLRDLKNFMVAHSEQYTEEEEDADIGFKVSI